MFELDPEAVKSHHKSLFPAILMAILHSHKLEGDLLLLLNRELTGVLWPLEDSKLRSYKSYNLLAARQAMARTLVTLHSFDVGIS